MLMRWKIYMKIILFPTVIFSCSVTGQFVWNDQVFNPSFVSIITLKDATTFSLHSTPLLRWFAFTRHVHNTNTASFGASKPVLAAPTRGRPTHACLSACLPAPVALVAVDGCSTYPPPQPSQQNTEGSVTPDCHTTKQRKPINLWCK